jgi:hypothetical protein
MKPGWGGGGEPSMKENGGGDSWHRAWQRQRRRPVSMAEEETGVENGGEDSTR